MVVPLDARGAVNAALAELCGESAANTFDVVVYGDDGVAIGYVCSWDLGATGFGDLVDEVQATIEKAVAEAKLDRKAALKEATVVRADGAAVLEAAQVVAESKLDTELGDEVSADPIAEISPDL